jgi:formamidopyrimidine-DNA glycosylase
MPELPEVEHAVQRLRPHVEGRTIAHIERLHAATQRALTARRASALVGTSITSLSRRGKYQRFVLDSGATLVAHFRLDGDWHIGPADAPPPRFARLTVAFTDGTRIALLDPRAFATVTFHAPDDDPTPGLGPEPWDPALTDAAWHAALARRSSAIKLVLLDQRVIAGVGNIYAAEGLWHAQVHPDRPAKSLRRDRAARLLAGVRLALQRGLDEPGRVFGTTVGSASSHELMVYARDGEPCHRCRRAIRRVVHAGRGTWYCPGCQR